VPREKPEFFAKNIMKAQRVSVHGGHSAEYCNHAKDSLEEIVQAYIDRGFNWVGITEHMPAVNNRFVYPDERAAGLDASALQGRFDDYFERCRRLKHKYRGQIDLLVGFESETYTGAEAFIEGVIDRHAPEYFVGSLHHVDDIEIDYTAEVYKQAADLTGGLDNLYCRYFDQQLRMIRRLKPAVIGHFDLIRIFDPDYPSRLRGPAVQHRIRRNLAAIKELGLILDLNLAGFDKEAGEQYPSRDILIHAIELGIAIVPGDDSHGVQTVGRHFEAGVDLLMELGASLEWQRPVT